MINRLLKFRAWDSQQKRMYYPEGNVSGWNNEFGYPEIGQNFDVPEQGVCSTNGFLYDSEIIVQQFTGFKDSQQKEIYEGDICRYTQKGMFATMYYEDQDCEVYWSGNGWHIKGGNFNWLLNNSYGSDKCNHLIVISNIFECKLKR